jgi:hypothetical protein
MRRRSPLPWRTTSSPVRCVKRTSLASSSETSPIRNPVRSSRTMIARSRLEPRRSLSRSTACSCSRDGALAGGGSTSTRGTRGAGSARVEQRRRGREREVHRRRRQATVDQPQAPITQHRPAVILPVDGEECVELAAIGQMRNELAHPPSIAGTGSSGERLTSESAFVVGEDLLGLHAWILSEPPDGRLAPSTSPLCAIHGAWGAANAGCQNHPRSGEVDRPRFGRHVLAVVVDCCISELAP